MRAGRRCRPRPSSGRPCKRRGPASLRSRRPCARLRSRSRASSRRRWSARAPCSTCLIQNQQLLTTQSQLVTAQHDAALAEFNLASAVGRLIAPELNLPVRLYDMEQHYKQVKDKWIGFRGGLSE